MSLETHSREPEQKEISEKPYHLIYSKVDGVDLIPGDFEMLEIAMSEADKLQKESDTKGNC